MHPERVGPYLIDRKIGAGGMGNVYHGTHESTQQEAAIKVLPAAMAREEGFVQRFSREIDALRQLSNKHIVQLFQDGMTSDGTPYYAMEFVDGITLTTAITDRRRLPWKDVIELALQIAAALKAAHDAGIIHRDLKPSNLMLTKDGLIKLTDFGVASLFASSRLTRIGGVVGTAEYMSPEQARGQRASRRSDLYSLGAVMYAMLTGRPPFTGPTANDILQKHQFSQFDRPSRFAADIPRLLEELVCQLLEKDPAKRLPDALVVMKRLEQIRTRLEYVEQNLESETIERPGPGTTLQFESDDSPIDQSPGPATMVRNMIREEATASLQKTPIARFFDNVFVLLTLLALIIVFGIWMTQRNAVVPAEQLAEAQAVLEKKASPAWIRARDDLLQPLLDQNQLPESQGEIQDLIQQVNEYDFCRSLRTDPVRKGDSTDEVERLMKRAFAKYTEGDVAAAREQLESVRELLKLSRPQSYFVQYIDETLDRWAVPESELSRTQLLNATIAKVTERRKEGASSDELQQILQSAEQLYGDDRTVAKELAQLRSLVAGALKPSTDAEPAKP